ncbi:MAG: M20/M25/M40 family metallo-hydrolase [Capsulimonadales bacterium]|nr:M20/M25/M40 family metallo-hydrolase [Capsulimonadales bacterium]
MRKTIRPAFLLLILALSSSVVAQPEVRISGSERQLAEKITAEQLKDYLTFVASDAIGGRETPSAGQNVTAQFIAFHLKQWGFKPGGDNGTFFQKITLNKNVPVPEKTLLKIGDKNFAYGRDFYCFSGSGSAEGTFVFAGNGWMVKSKGIDAYAGVDVKDKIVVLSAHQGGLVPLPPAGVTQEDITKGTSGVDWASPVQYAALKGAKAVIVIVHPEIEKLWRTLVGAAGLSAEGLDVPLSTPDPAIPVLFVRARVGQALLEGEAGNETSGQSFVIRKTGAVGFTGEIKKFSTQNVVAIWEGRDRKLKEEMVAVGAHYDHLGSDVPEGDEDVIFNGADDDGSGTVAVLAMAETLAKTKTRPKRSVLFVWHTSEERGQRGSRYFTKYPTVDLKKVVTQLNIDMIGRSKREGDTNPANKDLTKPNEIYVIGSNMMSSTLGRITLRTNHAFTGMEYNYRYDAPDDPDRIFYRSDHFFYAQKGIPIVFWFDGIHEDYHQPGDEVEKIDFAKMERVTRTIFLTLLKVADLDQRPAVDQKLPPELTNPK